MNLSSSREFLITNKYKEFINILDNLIENIPKKDYFYKDKLKELSIKLLYFINKANNENNYKNISIYKVEINSFISVIDYILERIFIKHYISESNLKKVTYKLSEINKMCNKWMDNKIEYDSKNK